MVILLGDAQMIKAVIARCHAVPLMYVCVRIFQPYAQICAHIHSMPSWLCMYNPVILVHCIGRFTMAALGWTDTGSENEPSFKRKRPSLQRKRARNPRASRGGPTRRSTPHEVVGRFTRYRLLSCGGSFSLSSLKTRFDPIT